MLELRLASAVPRLSGKGLAAGRLAQRGRDSSVRAARACLSAAECCPQFWRVWEGAGSDSEDGFDPEEEVPSTPC